MLRRSLAILSIVALLILTVTSPAAAGRRWDKPAPDATTEYRTSCNTNANQNTVNPHSQQHNATSSSSRSGVSAWIDPNPDGFDICSATLTDFDDNGPNAYVSLEPQCSYAQSCPPYVNTLNAILQIGIMECAGLGNPTCGGDGHPHYYWANGGCDGYWPKAWDLGAADYGNHQYQIYLTGNGTIRGTIDGALKFEVSDSSYARIQCWESFNLLAVWAGERFDYGDSLGNVGRDLVISGARYGLYGSGWHNPNWPANTPCYFTAYDESCLLNGGQNINIITSS